MKRLPILLGVLAVSLVGLGVMYAFFPTQSNMVEVEMGPDVQNRLNQMMPGPGGAPGPPPAEDAADDAAADEADDDAEADGAEVPAEAGAEDSEAETAEE